MVLTIRNAELGICHLNIRPYTVSKSAGHTVVKNIYTHTRCLQFITAIALSQPALPGGHFCEMTVGQGPVNKHIDI